MGLRDIGEALPPGFRFYPSDQELVCHYLYKKIANEEVHRGTLVEIDLHICEPWMLPDVAKLNSNEWYFFSFRDRKYATGFRTNRATTSGYWKATGKDRSIFDPRTSRMVGMRKTLVFYKNRAPNGIKTGWIMHEFRLENPYVPPKEDWVLCRVFYKSRSSPGEENSNRIMVLPHDHDFHDSTTAVATSPNLSVCQTNNNASKHVYHQTLITPCSNDHNIGPTAAESGYVPHLLGPNGIENKTVDTIGARSEDDFGYLLDFCGTIELGLGDMEFEDDHGSVLM